MTETSASGGGTGAHVLATERRIADFLARTVREDLISDAFAFRPLPVRTGRPGKERRPALRWLPHVGVVCAALLCLGLVWTAEYGQLLAPLSALLVLLTMFRPVGAWWLSLGLCLVPAATGLVYESFAPAFVVLVIAASQARPRTVAAMWGVSAVFGLALTVARQDTEPEVAVYLFLAALALLAVVSLGGWRRARAQVEEKEAEVAEKTAEVARKEEVTLVERSRRTLLEERTTIARELHDVVAHHMSVVAIQAEAAPYRVSDPPPQLVAAFATIRENAVVALTELRRVLGVVRAEDAELPNAPQPTLADLDTLLDNVRGAGLHVEKRVTGRVRELPQGVELSAYRIVQEALSNTLRHAPGADAVVELSYVLGGFGLRVMNWAPSGPWEERDPWEDEDPWEGPGDREGRGEAAGRGSGNGFRSGDGGPGSGGRPDGEAGREGPAPFAPATGSGHGLTGMRERVAMLEGALTAGPTDSGGFEVSVWIPVPAAEPEQEPEPGAGKGRDAGPDAGPERETGFAAGPGTAVAVSRPSSGPAPAPALSFRKEAAPREGSG